MERTAGFSRVKTRPYIKLDDLRKELDQRGDAIRKRIAQFADIRQEEYFYELVYCLLTPQSSAVNAGKAVERLKEAGLFHREIEPADLLHQKDFYIRFHNTKGKHLKEAKWKFPEIQAKLGNGQSSEELREWLVKNVKGMGWKDASHFLRNIGHRNLAILDRHILRNLKRHRVITSLPKTLTPKRYAVIEHKFLQFANTIGITLDELDLLFWSRETGEILK